MQNGRTSIEESASVSLSQATPPSINNFDINSLFRLFF